MNIIKRLFQHHFFAGRSLRRMLVLYLMIGCLLPLALLSVMTYSSIYSILENKIQSGLNASLKKEAESLESTVINLDFASKQFALDGQIVDEVSAFLQEKEIYKKTQIMESIDNKIALVNFTNPYLGVTAYIMPEAEDQVLFTNFAISSDFNPDKLPPFMNYHGATYFGPHKTMDNASNNIVFSSLRAVRSPDERKLYIYLETNYNLFRKILSQESYGMKVSHLLLNERSDIIYVEDNDVPAGVQEIKWSEGSQIQEEYRGYRLFSYKSSQGWQLIAAVNKAAFNSEIYLWLKRIGIFAVGTLIFASLLALFIWKQVYRPLRKVNMEIVRMAETRELPVTFTNVKEFDLLLSNFQDMKTEINELILAVEDNEKQKSRLEIEKLLSQINPHFLHNTLNTVQWLARMNGQNEIDKLVTLLVKVLQYNLGKQSIIVTVQQEIEALKNYMKLQRIRYDYEFEFNLHVDDDLLYVAIPRFLLQPLVENAIYHGTGERHGRVDITIRSTGTDMMLLKVEDNGTGIDQQSFDQLLESDDFTKRRGLGIGLSYVNRMLKRFYGEHVLFRIEGVTDAGTAVTIEIPKKTKEEFDD